MSRKKLDPQVWPLLQKISVDSSLLPQYIYRGIFYDGAKIKDEAKWLTKWFPGAKPGVSQGKATSWSIDRETAANFMTDQDFIKDRKNGYYMLLKWKVDPKYVIADLRNLPVDYTFWNQQEIIVSNEATDYEIDTMIPAAEGEDGFRNFVKSLKGGQGAWGQSKTDLSVNFITIPYQKLSINDRILFKQISKMTVKEFKALYPNNRITDEPSWQDMGMPLYNYIRQYNSNIVVQKSTKNEVVFKVFYTMHSLDYNDATREIFKKVKAENDFNQFASSYEIVSNEGYLKLLDDDFYDLDIEVILPTRFSTEEDKEGSRKSGDKLTDDANIALFKIFDEAGGSKGFIEAFKNSQNANINKVSKNINISIK